MSIEEKIAEWGKLVHIRNRHDLALYIRDFPNMPEVIDVAIAEAHKEFGPVPMSLSVYYDREANGHYLIMRIHSKGVWEEDLSKLYRVEDVVMSICKDGWLHLLLE